MLKYRIISAVYILLIASSSIIIKEPLNFKILSLIILSMIYLAIVVWGVANIQSQMFVKTYNSSLYSTNKVAITFDDGPHDGNTEELLEILKRNGAKASFFLIGENIQKQKSIAHKIVKEGHCVGNHSYCHKNFFPVKFPGKIKKELELTQVELKKLTGNENKYFRPPFGVTNPFLYWALRKMDLKVIGWNIRSFDTIKRNREKILHRILKKIKGGDIILLHDKSEHVCWLTEEILKHLNKRNLKAATIEELVFG